MKQQEVFKKIGGIIKEIKEQYDYLSADEASLNDLELELFVANAQFLKDHAEILRKLCSQHIALPEQFNRPPVTTAEQPIIKPEPVIENQPAPPASEPVYHNNVPEIVKPGPQFIREPEKPLIPADTQPAQDLPARTEESHNPSERFFEPVAQQQPALPLPTQAFELPAHPGKTTETIQERIELNKQLDDNAAPVPNVDLTDRGSDRESYSFIRQEPEVTRQELEVNEADLADNEETAPASPEPESPKVTPVYHTPQPAEVPPPSPAPLYENYRVQPVAAEMPAQPVTEQKPVQPVVEERSAQPIPPPPDDKVLTLNQRLSAQLGQQTSSPLHSQKITDLRSAITLNDKLMFVKDLFNGYSLAYSEAIEILNRFNNFDEADKFLRVNYYNKNNWEGKPTTTEKFYDLLRRRFS